MAHRAIPCVASLTFTTLLAAVPPVSGAQSVPVPVRGVCTPAPAVAALVAEGQRRSSTFRALLRKLDASDWIVFIQRGSCQLPGVSSCLLHRIGEFHGVQYLRIVVSELPRSEDEAIATIGHELQHAIEVVSGADVRTSRDIQDLYRRIGYVVSRTTHRVAYETLDAQKIRAMVVRELRADSELQAGSRATGRSPRVR